MATQTQILSPALTLTDADVFLPVVFQADSVSEMNVGFAIVAYEHTLGSDAIRSANADNTANERARRSLSDERIINLT